jgi:hypothetical protein
MDGREVKVSDEYVCSQRRLLTQALKRYFHQSTLKVCTWIKGLVKYRGQMKVLMMIEEK